MSAHANQAYLNTRVSILATRLFSPAVAGGLAGSTLEEISQGFGLPAILDQGLSARAKNRAIEQALITTLLAELCILIRPMQPAERALVLNWGRKYALFNLKSLIRGKLYNLDPREIQDNLYHLPPQVELPVQELLRTENVLELLRQLEQGPYRFIAHQAREVYEQKREPFALEATIDQLYYQSLARQVRQFHDGEQRPLQVVVGALLDQIDLMWLLRFRFAYGLSPSETFYQLVPSLRLLRRDLLLQLANLDSLERVLESLPEPLNGLLAGSTSLIEVQKRIGRYTAREAHQVLRHSSSAVARTLSYLILREMDLFLLFALTQGKILGLPADVVAIAVELADPNCPMVGRLERTVA
jgi:V/A-type H+/Na+-transporting ATPase subunit C